MLPRRFLSIACTLSLAASLAPSLVAAAGGARAAVPAARPDDPNAPPPEPAKPEEKTKPQEPAKPEETPAPTTEPPKPAGKGEAKAPAAGLTDRLEVRAGTSWLTLRASVRGTTKTSDPLVHPGAPDPNSRQHLQQTIYDTFDSASGAAPRIDVSYKVLPRLTAFGGYTMSRPTGATFTDDRLIGDFSGPGDFTLARFSSDAAPEINQFDLGARFRALPTKKHGPASQYVDLIVQFESTRTHYEFHTGVLTANPFDPNALTDPVFTAKSNLPASYNLNFLSLGGGFRIGGTVTHKLSYDVTFVTFFLGRYDGTGILTGHGLPFVHTGDHQDRAFHVPNCDSDPSTPANPPCGMVDVDLSAKPLEVTQHSSRSRGLNAAVNFEYDLFDWFGVAAGYRRDYLRSVGGEEKRSFSTQGFPSELGDIDRAAIVGDAVTIAGRFRFF